MKELLELLAVQGGKIVCSASLTPEEINNAREEHRMCVDESGIGYVYVNAPDYEQKFRECLVILKRLSFAAQTTGGTAGPDIGLQGVISEAEQFIKANKG